MEDDFSSYDDPILDGTDYLTASSGSSSPSSAATATSAPAVVNGGSSNVIGDFIGNLTTQAGKLATTAGPVLTAIQTYTGGGTAKSTATAAAASNVAAAQNTKTALSGYLMYAAYGLAGVAVIGLIVWAVKKLK